MNGAVQEFETAARCDFLPVWEQAAQNVRKNTSPRLSASTTIPPRIKISERVLTTTSPMRLRAAFVPAWPFSPGQDSGLEFRCTAEPFTPKPRVWVRTSNPLRHGLRTSNPATIWTQPRNSYMVGQKLRPMDPLKPAAAEPVMRFAPGRVGPLSDLPMAPMATFMALLQVGGLPHRLPLARPDAIPGKPAVVSLHILKPASPQPALTFTQGFRPAFKHPNSYSRRLQPRPRLDICEPVTFPGALHPVSLGQTLKESDTPADHKDEINQPRHARQLA